MFSALLIACAGFPWRAFAGAPVIYPEFADAHAEIQQALSMAAKEHKRVILDFGGNWCAECQVLNQYLHDENNLRLLVSNFVLVHIDIGHMDRNTDIASRYGVPITKGVPALAVLSEHGKVLYSQKNKEGEAMSRTDEASVTEFLNKWKP
ncbi:thioredoxin family protein [Acidisarcina polymorpha]|uniref:thioredoxin family protein n=1 Tax=Acidisarcina polymorpha TaxID=2211140 RepID=UPI001F47A71C|nr:thioredoxin family protein [Acidisarcina polymorpha]